MEIKKIVELRSPDGQWVLEKKLNSGASCIEVTLMKLSKIYELAAKNQALYAYTSLSRLVGLMEKTKHSLNQLINEFEIVILQQKVDISKIRVTEGKLYEVRIGQHICAELITLIEMYDHLNCLIKIADKLNLFKKRAHFFKTLSRNHRRIMGVIARIMKFDEVKIAKVSIAQYLERADEYFKVAQTLGEIKPKMLHAALHIDMLPRLSTKARNIIMNKLKDKE